MVNTPISMAIEWDNVEIKGQSFWQIGDIS